MLDRALRQTKDVKNAILRTEKETACIVSLLAREQIEALQSRQRAIDSRRLAAHGFKVYSQSDEDGILQEIFARIGATSKTFIEFGCGDGLENNTIYLMTSGWMGSWMDGGAENIESIRRLHHASLSNGTLVAEQRMLTAENINQTLAAVSKTSEIDLLSIDIDGNDYWVWQAITGIRPRVVAIEYNAAFRPPVSVVQKYRPDRIWDGTNAFGASLKALEELGRTKGYALVGCNVGGMNAFFVRDEYADERFHGPFTAENHYMPPNYDLFSMVTTHAHPPGIGDYVVEPHRAQRAEKALAG